MLSTSIVWLVRSVMRNVRLLERKALRLTSFCPLGRLFKLAELLHQLLFFSLHLLLLFLDGLPLLLLTLQVIPAEQNKILIFSLSEANMRTNVTFFYLNVWPSPLAKYPSTYLSIFFCSLSSLAWAFICWTSMLSGLRRRMYSSWLPMHSCRMRLLTRRRGA